MDTSGSFVSNMSLPVHRWFRYSSGFSASWVSSLIADEVQMRDVCVFDPFAGSATTLIAAEQCEVPAIGIDSHRFIARVARAKLAYRSSADAFRDRVGQVMDLAQDLQPALEEYPPLIRKCYTDQALADLDVLRRSIEETTDETEATLLVFSQTCIVI